MFKENEPIGVIVIFRREVRPFSDKQIELVTTFADQAVIAIENVRLFDEVQARTRSLRNRSRSYARLARSPRRLTPRSTCKTYWTPSSQRRRSFPALRPA